MKLAKAMTNFLYILSLLALLFAAPSQSTYFSYEFSRKYGPDQLTLQGDAHFPSNERFLHLTKTNDSGYPERYSAGRVLHPTPVQLWRPGEEANFGTTIEFRILPVDNNPGDGMVFFIAPVGSTIPTGYSGGNFGVFNTSVGVNPSIFAVEFDTFLNGDLDPPYRHIGIDIEHLVSSNTTRVDDGILSQEMTAYITYEDSKINVIVENESETFEVSYMFNLSTVLNQQVQVGLAATTGGAVAIHEIQTWTFTSDDLDDPDDDTMIRQYV